MSQAKFRKPFTIIVEGNIGSGKTTFLNNFAKSENAFLLSEPVDIWRNFKGNNLLVSDQAHNLLILIVTFLESF